MTRIASRKYLDGAKGETCKLRIVGVCQGDRETVVACHVRDRHTGRSIKASDVSVIDGCQACHDVFDLRAKKPNGAHMNTEEWLFYALRGLQETIENRIERGLLFVQQDTHREPTPRVRKPRDQRKPVPARKAEWPKREMHSRSTFQTKGK